MWTTAGKSRPNRPKTQTPAGKVWAFVVGDAQGIFFINYLEKVRTFNSEYYIALLVRLEKEINKKTVTNEEEKSALLPRQCTVSQVDRNDSKTIWIELWTASAAHPIFQIWPLVTTGYLQTSKECSRERDLAPMKWSWKLRRIFETKVKSFYKNVI